jgi:hypothetical protein
MTPLFNGFTASDCSSCRATANVLNGEPGWFCPCGHYNFQSWSDSQIPYTTFKTTFCRLWTAFVTVPKKI